MWDFDYDYLYSDRCHGDAEEDEDSDDNADDDAADDDAGGDHDDDGGGGGDDDDGNGYDDTDSDGGAAGDGGGDEMIVFTRNISAKPCNRAVFLADLKASRATEFILGILPFQYLSEGRASAAPVGIVPGVHEQLPTPALTQQAVVPFVAVSINWGSFL